MASTFISYRREDAAGYAGRLRESLERRLGDARVFRDVDTLRPGQDFVQAIEATLTECRVMLIIIGREWLDARDARGMRRLDEPYDLVRLEIAAALARGDVLIVPVLVEGAQMPPGSALPDAIRGLARRHAVSVRDETWDADVDRLVAIIEGVGSTGRDLPTRRGRRALPWLAGAALAAIAVVLALVARPSLRSTDVSPNGVDRAADAPIEPVESDPPAADTAPFSPYTIDIPRVAEAAFQDLVYTVVSGNVVARGTTRELRLRIRLSNYGSEAVNFWDDSFRLVVGPQSLPPASGLNTVMASRSLGYGIITFRLPSRVEAGVLRITGAGAAADVPLDLTETGRPPVDEQAEIADSLSQAIAARVVSEPAALLVTPDWSISLERATRRRFANVTRLTLSLRLRNHGSAPRFSGDVLLRASAAGVDLAPWKAPADAVPPESSASADAVFDLPPSTTTLVLHAVAGGRQADRTIDVR